MNFPEKYRKNLENRKIEDSPVKIKVDSQPANYPTESRTHDCCIVMAALRYSTKLLCTIIFLKLN